MKLGYERIKEKVKNVRQDYRGAVHEGTRSRSGKWCKKIKIYYLIYEEVLLLRRHCLGIDCGCDETPGSSGITSDREDESSEGRLSDF